MAITIAVGGTVSSTSNTTAYTTSAFTPAAGDLLAVFVEWDTTTGGLSVSDSQGGSWTLVSTNVRNVGDNRVSCYVRDSTVSASSMTVTLTDAGGAQGCNASVFVITGASGAGSVAIRQSKTAADAAASTPAVTFDAACLTGNATIVAVVNPANPSGVTAPTSWTAGSNIGHTSNTTGLATAYRNSGFTGTAVTWGSSSGDWAAIVVEVIAGSSVAQTVPVAPVLQVTNWIPPVLIGEGCSKTVGNRALAVSISVSALSRVAVLVGYDADITVTSITDTKGNKYTLVPNSAAQTGVTDAGIRAETWVSNLALPLVAGTDTITVTWSGTTSAGCAKAYGFNGQYYTLEGVNTQASTGTATSTTITPVNLPCIGIVGVAVEGPAADTYTEDATFTSLGAEVSTGDGGAADSNITLQAAFIMQGTAAATPHAATLGTSRDFAVTYTMHSYADADPPIVSGKPRLPIMGVGG